MGHLLPMAAAGQKFQDPLKAVVQNQLAVSDVLEHGEYQQGQQREE